MGVISSTLNSALENLGRATMDVGNNGLLAGYHVWEKCCKITIDYLRADPVTAGGSAYAIVTGNLYSLSMGIASSLSILFFVIGWLRESIDVRNNFTLENMFRFFIRYILTATLIVNSLSFIRMVIDCSVSLVGAVDLSAKIMKGGNVKNVFADLISVLEKGNANGTAFLGTGIICMIAGIFGAAVIVVCAVQLILSVLSRLFKLYLCIPFAPVALSSFAGGASLSVSGISYLKTLFAYTLEAVVIAIAIKISFGLFSGGSFLGTGAKTGTAIGAVLTIVEYCLPMVTACACVKGAEAIIRRCLGLG